MPFAVIPRQPASTSGQAFDRPVFLARAGLDYPFILQGIDLFVQKALERNLPLELANHPSGRHAFDIFDDHPLTRHIIARTLAFMVENLA